MLVADAKSNLERDLRLSHPSQAFDCGPLAVILICTRMDPPEKVLENLFTADEFLVTSKRDNPVPLARYFTMLAGS